MHGGSLGPSSFHDAITVGISHVLSLLFQFIVMLLSALSLRCYVRLLNIVSILQFGVRVSIPRYVDPVLLDVEVISLLLPFQILIGAFFLVLGDCVLSLGDTYNALHAQRRNIVQYWRVSHVLRRNVIRYWKLSHTH